MNFCLLLLFATCLTSFEYDADQPSKPRAIKLEVISGIPTDIDGCSESFSTDTASLKDEHYIAVTNFAELGFIRDHGKLLRLTKSSGGRGFEDSPKFGDIVETIFEGQGYRLIIRTKSKQISDELYIEIGTIEIDHGKSKEMMNVVGESGC
jgi:hypothetical protein